MSPSIRAYTKRNRADQAGQMIGVRLQPEDLAALDEWIAGQPDAPTRPEAIRRLMRDALSPSID